MIMNHSVVRSLLLAVGFIGLGSLTVSAWDEPDASVESYSTLSTNLVTPHTPWARPYSQGPLRGYYFVCSRNEGMQTHAREAVELMQRLDLTLDASLFYSYYGEYWFGGDAGERRVARLMRKPYDVFIFQDLPPSTLPTNAVQNGRTPFLEQVRGGAGVVLIGADDGKLFAEAEATTNLPAFLAGTGALKVMTVGKGRVVQMPARPKIGYHLGWEVEYDYWQEQLTRAVLWAAQREPRMQLQIACEPALDRQKLPVKALRVSWKGATPKVTNVSLRLRRWDGETRDLGNILCGRSEESAAFELPRVRAGIYRLEAFARNARGVENWATAPLEITALATIATLDLVSRQPLPLRPDLATKPGWYEEHERRGAFTPYVEVGDEIRGHVAATGAVQGLKTRLSLVDPSGRVLLRKDLSAEGEQTFAFLAEPWMPALLRVEATLVKGDEEVASDYRFQRITNRRQGKFNFVLWDAPGDETLGPYAMEQLEKMGVTAILHHTPAPLTASAHGMAYVPWTGGNVHGRDAEEWSDPDYGKGYAERYAVNSRGAGVLSYSLGDEGRVSGMGTGPKTDAAFRAYLKNTYGDIGSLNKAWDGSYEAFDAITVSSATGGIASAVAGIENHGRAYDLYYFGGYNFVQMAKNTREWIQKSCDDPQAGIGFEGSGHIGKMPCDPELICRELDMWVPYTGITEEFIRSVAPRGFVRSAWIGYSKDAANHAGWYWRHVMAGADSVWYWMWSAIGAWQGLQGPDLEAPAPVQAMLDDTRIVRDGLGDLLLNYEMRHDGIAVLYSYPSLFLQDRGERNQSYPPLHTALMAWQNVIHDLNMQYDFVTETSLANGEFAAGGYKVLILPQVWAMSDQAAETVRRFAEGGGTVLADIRPAQYDAHCRRRPSAALDGLFGVEGGFDAAQSAGMTLAGELGLSKLELARPGPEQDRPVRIEPGVAVTSGKALGQAGLPAGNSAQAGETPVCIVNTVGQGRAVLLNFTPDSTFLVRADTRGLAGTAPLNEMPRDAALFFLGLFNAAGVERAFSFTPYRQENVPFFPNVKVQRWKSGDYQIVGFFRQTDTEVRYGTFLPDSKKWPVSPQRATSGRSYDPYPWVYDIKNEVTVGQANGFVTEINPGSPSLYALLPGPLPPIKVEAPETTRRGSPMTVKVSVPEARGLHAIKLRATQPSGKAVRFWDQTVLVGKEPKTVVLPLAWNDPSGNWTLNFTDLFGPNTERTWTISVE